MFWVKSVVVFCYGFVFVWFLVCDFILWAGDAGIIIF